MKKMISVIGAFMLFISTLSVFTGAVSKTGDEPDRSVDPARDYVLPYTTTIRESASLAAPEVCAVPSGYRVRDVQTSNSGWYYSTTQWRKVTYGSYTGYIRNNYLIPANKSYVTQGSSIMLYVNGPGTTPIVSIPSGKRACYMGSQSSGGTTYYQVRVYGVSYNGYSYVVGYIPSGKLAVNYGYGN